MLFLLHHTVSKKIYTQHEAQLLMDRVAEAIGMEAMQRVYVLYGWLIHATYFVFDFGSFLNLFGYHEAD